MHKKEITHAVGQVWSKGEMWTVHPGDAAEGEGDCAHSSPSEGSDGGWNS